MKIRILFFVLKEERILKKVLAPEKNTVPPLKVKLSSADVEQCFQSDNFPDISINLKYVLQICFRIRYEI